jgi:hypothetical protein
MATVFVEMGLIVIPTLLFVRKRINCAGGSMRHVRSVLQKFHISIAAFGDRPISQT